jgi:hypothetical protein
MTATCETCRFRKPDSRPEYASSGYCRRYPPQVAQWTHPDYNGPQYDQHWPWMAGEDFCGEHQPKEQQP